MQIGQLVRVNGLAWYGEITDVAETDRGVIMIRLNSPKSVWHGHAPEWLEYTPEQIAPATAEEARRDIDLYLSRLEMARKSVEAMADRWGVK